MTGPTRLRAPLAAFLLLGAALLAAVPAAEAHNCVARTFSASDPPGCDGHDCTGGTEAHLWHIVYHEGDNASIHGCGILFHVGVDGQGRAYVCIPAMRCLELKLGGVGELLA